MYIDVGLQLLVKFIEWTVKDNIEGDRQWHTMFTFYFTNEYTEEALEIGEDEDIEYIMKLFINSKWEELFPNQYHPLEFNYATFNGISFSNNDKNNVIMQIYGPYLRGSCRLDLSSLADKNAEKLKRIREITTK